MQSLSGSGPRINVRTYEAEGLMSATAVSRVLSKLTESGRTRNPLDVLLIKPHKTLALALKMKM